MISDPEQYNERNTLRSIIMCPLQQLKVYLPNVQLQIKHHFVGTFICLLTKTALAGNQTQIYCLEGSNANHYTPNALLNESNYNTEDKTTKYSKYDIHSLLNDQG